MNFLKLNEKQKQSNYEQQDLHNIQSIRRGIQS